MHRGHLFRKPSFTAAAVRKHVGLVGHGQDKEVHHQPPAVSEAVCKQSSAPQCQLSPLRPNASSALCHSALAAARQPAAAMRLLRLLGTRWQAAASQLGRCSNRARDRMEWFPMLTRARARPCRFAQVVEVIHPGLAGVSKKDLKEKLATMYKVRRYHGSGRLRAGSVGSSGGSSTRTSGSTRRQQLHRLRQWRQQSAAPSGLWPDARLLPLERDAPHQRRQWRHTTNTSAPPAYCTAGAPQAAAAPAHHTRLTSRLSALRFVRSPTPAASSCTASRSLLAVAAARALA